MKENVLQRALEPFFTTKVEKNGAGLGLSAVDSFVKQAGGFVTIESQPGAGTTVTLSLPRSAKAGAVSHPVKDFDDAPRGDGEVVLVVEDDDQVREVTLKRVEALGYVAEEARSAAGARARLTVGGVRHCPERHCHARRPGWRRSGAMDVRQSAFCADRAGDGFSGRTWLRRAPTLAMRFRIDQALFAKALAAALSRELSRVRAQRSETSLAKT